VKEANRWLTPVKVNGEDTYRADRSWRSTDRTKDSMGGPASSRRLELFAAMVDIRRTTRTSQFRSLPPTRVTASTGITNPQPFQQPFATSLIAPTNRAVTTIFSTGPDLDKVVCRLPYVDRPGSMFGKWAYGFWQCKKCDKRRMKFRSSAQISRTAIPATNIVQDWFW